MEPEDSELMKFYGVSRILKEKMLVGNDEIIKFIERYHNESGKGQSK